MKDKGLLDQPVTADGEAPGSILDNPDLLLQQFNHQISLHQ